MPWVREIMPNMDLNVTLRDMRWTSPWFLLSYASIGLIRSIDWFLKSNTIYRSFPPATYPNSRLIAFTLYLLNHQARV